MEVKQELVSVCIPAYRKPDKLRRCLESVYRQDYGRFEVICTDDTPDETVKEVVEEFQAAGHAIQYFHNETSLGSPENWNSALSRARGAYVIVLHHDDFFLTPSALQNLVSTLTEDPRAIMAVATARDIDETGAVLSSNTPTSEQLTEASSDPSILAFGNFLGPPSAVLVRNSPPLRFDRRFIWLVDVEFYARVLKLTGGRVVSVPKAIVGVSVEPGRLTDFCLGNPTLVMREQLLFFALLGLGPKDPRVRSYLREFAAPSWDVLAVAFGFPHMGFRTLLEFAAGTVVRFASSIKHAAKRIAFPASSAEPGRKK